MSKRSDRECLLDIHEALQRIEAYIADMTLADFVNDKKTQDAVVRNLEVIGEATKNLSNQIRDTSPEVPWKGLAGVRDKMIHHYFGINYEIVWTICKDELPMVRSHVEQMLQDLN